MQQKYASRLQAAFLYCLLAIAFCGSLQAQVVKPFVQRSSQYTPEKKIYNIKGDFTMVGNTNMTLQNYGNQTQNGNNVMQYVDVDASGSAGLGGLPTFNSSAATLTLSTENGAIPECSNIIFAGLYWTGRAANSAPSQMTFDVTKDIVTGSTPFSNNHPALTHNNAVPATSYMLSVSRNGGTNNYYPRYTFGGGGNLYQFNFTNAGANMVSVSVNGGPATFLPATIATSGFVKTATLNTPYSFNNGSVTITINQLIRDSRTDRSVVETQQASAVNLTVSGVTSNTTPYTKTFDKRKIQFRGPGASEYTEITANNNDIYYPQDAYDYMYSAYAEVTDYVRTHGLGEYFAADIALTEGNGGGTGYYGGWGLIVIYENTKMKYRDVTLFDGYAYVIGGTANNLLPIEGFNTVQSGPVGLKLGIIAGEGDRDITGDYFQIQRQSDGVFQNLNHSANTPENFFNSSIQTSSTRNPNLMNNTGLDLDMFEVPNPDNSVITNGQTSTTFRYGSIQDTYIIFAMAMAVDAYIPEIEGEVSAVTINGQPAGSGPYSVEPGQEMEFRIKVRNRGTEPLDNARLVVPIPFNTDYVNGSAQQSIFFTPLPSPNALSFNPGQGANGALVWDIGSLPLPESPDVVLGELVFKLTVTEDCNLLQQNCTNVVQVNGSVSATGSITDVSVNNLNLILGYEPNGNCLGNALPAPLNIALQATQFIVDNCQGIPEPVSFTFCTPAAGIPITEISGSFPSGSTFYNEYPLTSESIQYTINNPFPATPGATTYYAVPPQGQGCFFAFTITVSVVEESPVIDAPEVTYCVGAQAAPLSATASDPSHTLYYFTTPDGSPQLSLTPSTAVPGTFIYYVAEGESLDCYGPLAEIIVNVVPGITLSAPADAVYSGCGAAAISGLPFAETQTAITLPAFQSVGGSVSHPELEGLVIRYLDTRSGNCPVQVIRTFSVEGPCGTQSVSQQISVEDQTPPVISELPAPVTLTGCETTPEFATPLASDNCEGIVSLNFEDQTTFEGCLRTTTRTWTAIDLCGNAATASQSISFTDNTPPVFEALPQPSTIDCGQDPVFADAIVTDACSTEINLTFEDSQTPGTCAGSIVFTRTWTAADSCGNQTTASQTITRMDQTAPVISVQAQPLDLECSAADANSQIQAWLAQNGGASATDACSDISWTHDFENAPSNCSDVVTVTFTATDGCGNTATSTAALTISDTTPPGLPEIPANQQLSCGEPIEEAQVLTALDSCSGEIIAEAVETETPGQCEGSTIITRTWTFTDACNNSISASQTITVTDTTAPVIPEIPSDLVLSCPGEIPEGQPLTTIDACSGETITAVPVDVMITADCENSFVITRTWTFTDGCNNSALASQTITVTDNIAPEFTSVPASETIACGTEPVFGTAVATDNCQGDVTLTFADETTAGECAGSSVITRTWTATDSCGNQATASQAITVLDTTPPVISVQASDAEIICEATGDQLQAWLASNAGASGADSCSEITWTNDFNGQSGSCGEAVTVTFTATDACGNSASTSASFTIIDTIAPVVPEAPADIAVSCAAEIPAAAVLIALDGCSGEIQASATETITAGLCANNFVVVRTWTFTDDCNNSASVSQTITVDDTTPPVAPEAPADVTVSCAAEVPAMQILVATDGCDGEQIQATPFDVITAGSCANSYVITRTWSFADACKNGISISQIITVNDTQAPVFVSDVPADLTLNCEEIPSAPVLIATDNCGGAEITAVLVETTEPGSCAGNYTLTRTWTATDACNNAVSVSQTITVQDTTGPVVQNAPEDLALSCGSEIPEGTTLTAIDACSGETLTAEPTETTTPGSCANSYTITRTWTFTDDCGNETVANQTISVTDNQAPVFTVDLAGEITVNCGEVPVAPQVTASDDCSAELIVAVLTETSEAGACPEVSIITRTWTATDACGNSQSMTQIIRVTDTTGPVLETPFDETVTVNCEDIPPVPELSFSDACSEVGVVTFVETATSPENGSYTLTRTWGVSDSCGNDSTFIQIVNVSLNGETIPATGYAACNTDDSLIIDLTELIPDGVASGGTFVDVDNSGGLQGSSFVPLNLETGVYAIDYASGDPTCPQMVRISMTVDDDCIVLEECEPFVHNAFSPNGDGKNDVFVIQNFDVPTCIVDNHVEIYNRWGVKVFDMEDYDNQTRVFRGISDGRATVKQGDELPAGTYFYIISYTKADGTHATKDGYLYLSR